MIIEREKMTDEEIKNFKEKLIKHAEMCVKRYPNCSTEEACKQGLILPFISLLGYDVFDVNEVVPEHSADFSDKYKNRVDYAILRNNEAVIAIECKQHIEKTDRGQLKSYFNAIKSVKLGILTDGLNYEFFADCDSPNMMDEEPFLIFDFNEFANGRIDNEQTKAILTFAKNEFDPDNVGAEAKKKVIFSSIINFLDNNLENPTSDFISYLLRNCEGINQRITQRVIDENKDIVKTAFQGFIDKKILDRVGLRDARVVKIEKKEENQQEINPIIPSDIITTDEELYAYNYCKQRLAFLVDTDELYSNIDKIACKDFRTTFTVFYKRERTGKIFNLYENSESVVFTFPTLNNLEIKCIKRQYKSIDEPLLNAYKLAVQTLK